MAVQPSCRVGVVLGAGGAAVAVEAEVKACTVYFVEVCAGLCKRAASDAVLTGHQHVGGAR